MSALLFFPIEITREESELGFAMRSSARGVMAIAAPIDGDLFAVKTRARDGSIEYRVCNRDLDPLYATARSLDELRERFRLLPRARHFAR